MIAIHQLQYGLMWSTLTAQEKTWESKKRSRWDFSI